MKRFVSKSLLCSVSVAWMSLVGCNVPQESAEISVEDVTQTASALAGDVTRVAGDTPCPSGSIPASAEDAHANKTAICNNQIGQWDIVRLAGGGSISGSGYNCDIFESDPRSLGHSLCKKPGQFTIGGDGICPDGYIVPGRGVANDHKEEICAKLWPGQYAWLAGRDFIKRPKIEWSGGYYHSPDCYIATDIYSDRAQGETVCMQYTFLKVTGDSPCGAGKTLLTPQEASDPQNAACPGGWDIARLEGGGSISGSEYGCQILDWDTRSMGHSICKSL